MIENKTHSGFPVGLSFAWASGSCQRNLIVGKSESGVLIPLHIMKQYISQLLAKTKNSASGSVNYAVHWFHHIHLAQPTFLLFAIFRTLG